jgi:hypothetical protein
VKRQIEKKGLYSKPDKRKQPSSTEKNNKSVIDFFNSDEINSVRRNERLQNSFCNGLRVEVQLKYNEDYPEQNVGFSRFCSLRPEECVLAGSKGTHSVCVCCIHQNFKLVCQALKVISDKYTNYEDFLRASVCEQSRNGLRSKGLCDHPYKKIQKAP